MLCIQLKNQNPYFCLAAEEYLMKTFSDDVFLLWQSNDTIVVGKHQNAMAEINYPFVHENHITVARRISGGGTVFHDAGNVNFTYIKNVASPAEISFKQFVQPIIEALASLGVKAVTSGRNDLLVEGKKISGNAEHIFKNRVLHHGTLLFNSNLETLGHSIKVVAGKYHGKAVQSNRSEVTNILPYLKKEQSIGEFNAWLLNYELGKTGNTSYNWSQKDEQAVQTLMEEKFKTWDWNFGYSPNYQFQNERQIDGKLLRVELQVERGTIAGAVVSGDYFSESQNNRLSRLLSGTRHFYHEIEEKIKEIPAADSDKLMYTFF